MRATTLSSANWLIACVSLVNPYGYVFHRQLPRSLRAQTGMRYRTGAVCRLSFSTGNTALGGIDGGDCGGRSGFCCRGEPWSGAIRYRGMLRIVGTFIGCIAGLTIIIAMIRAPFLMLTVCCIWAGFCTWLSSLVRVENSYAWGLAGYTALIIVVTIQSEPLLAPQFAVERCSEIVIGIVCAIAADLLFSPVRSNARLTASWTVCWWPNTS
jgi:hypothetical protein